MKSCLHKTHEYVPCSLPLVWYCKQKTGQDLEIKLYVPVYSDVTNVPVMYCDVTTKPVMYSDVTTDRSALKVANKHWKQLLEEQDFLATPEGWRKMLALVPDKVRETLDQEWQEKETTSIAKWKRLRNEVKVNFGGCVTCILLCYICS